MLALVMAALYYGTDAVQSLDRHLHDAASSRATHVPLDEIVVVAMDEVSLDSMGAWPWPRDTSAQLVDRLSSAGAKTIVLATPLDAPQSNLAQPFFQKIRGLLRTAPPEAAVLKEQVGRALDEADAALDADARLAISLRNAGNVLLPTQLLAPSGAAAGGRTLPSYVHRSALPDLPSRWRCSGRQLQASGTCRPGPRGWMASFARHPCSWVSMVQRCPPWRC